MLQSESLTPLGAGHTTSSLKAEHIASSSSLYLVRIVYTSFANITENKLKGDTQVKVSSSMIESSIVEMDPVSGAVKGWIRKTRANSSTPALFPNYGTLYCLQGDSNQVQYRQVQ